MSKLLAPERRERENAALRDLFTNGGQERRTFKAEYRAKKDDGSEGWQVNGYATVFDYEYPIYGGAANGGWDETITAGALAKTMSEKPDVAFLINHTGMTLARTKSGTLRLSTDTTGLKTEADLDGRSQTARELAIAMERGDMDEMSMAFWVLRDKWLTAEGDEVPWWDLSGIKRVITEIRIHKGDVSVVNYGANDATSAEVSARALLKMRATARLWTPDQRREARDLWLSLVHVEGGDDPADPTTESASCPTCEAKNSTAAKFCDQCGASMAQQTAADPAPARRGLTLADLRRLDAGLPV